MTVGPGPSWWNRKRKAAVWMLLEAGASAASVAQALDVSVKTVYQMRTEYERLLVDRERVAADWVESWARRLRAAGAIP